ncbi:MAG: hypothetical protein WB359_24185, partial [Bryobacteraceae bacterium]
MYHRATLAELPPCLRPPTQTAAWESPAKYGNDGTRERAGEFARANPAIKVIGEITRRGKGRGIREAVSIAS